MQTLNIDFSAVPDYNRRIVFYHAKENIYYHEIQKNASQSLRLWLLNTLEEASKNTYNLYPKNDEERNGWIIITNPKSFTKDSQHIAFIRDPWSRLLSGLAEEYNWHTVYNSTFKQEDILQMPDEKFLQDVLPTLLKGFHCVPQFYSDKIPNFVKLYDVNSVAEVFEKYFPQYDYGANLRRRAVNQSSDEEFKVVFLSYLNSLIHRNPSVEIALKNILKCDYQRINTEEMK